MFYKVCNISFTHGFDPLPPPPLFCNAYKHTKKWRLASLGQEHLNLYLYLNLYFYLNLHLYLSVVYNEMMSVECDETEGEGG